MFITNEKERDFLNRSESLFDEYRMQVFSTNRTDDMKEVSSRFYITLKRLAKEYYTSEDIPFSFRYITNKVDLFERFLPIKYIIPFASYDFTKNYDKPVDLHNNEAVLDYLVNQTRHYLFDLVAIERDILPFEMYDLQNHCLEASNYLISLARSMGIECYKVFLYPCFQKNSSGYGGGIHVFVMVIINGKKYMVDCTYSQFFLQGRTNLDRIGIPHLTGCAPGTFMIYDDYFKSIAQILLEKGWIEATDEVIKAYFDGFTISYRNGLYYERTNDFSFKTDYVAADYENFIYSLDSLFLHENAEEIRCQLRSLNNVDLLIRHR